MTGIQENGTHLEFPGENSSSVDVARVRLKTLAVPEDLRC